MISLSGFVNGLSNTEISFAILLKASNGLQDGATSGWFTPTFIVVFCEMRIRTDPDYSQRKQAKTPPNLLAPSGIQFERVNLIKVFARILPVLQTENLKGNKAGIGWISNPQSAEDAQWWADLLQRKFLLVVQAFVIGEAYLEGSHSEEAITKDLAMNSPFLTADNIRFPPVKPERELDLTTFGKNPFPVPDALDGTISVATGSRTVTFADLAEEGIQALDEVPEPDTSISELLRDVECRAREKEDEARKELFGMLADNGAEETELLIVPAAPEPSRESEFLQPLPISTDVLPTYYTNELANHYARANLWGKTEIHLELLEHEKRRLDTLNFHIHTRIEKLNQEASTIKSQILSMERRHQVLRSLYSQDSAALSALQKEQAKLEEASARSHKDYAMALQPTASSPTLSMQKRTAPHTGFVSGGRGKTRRVAAGRPGRLQNSDTNSNSIAPSNHSGQPAPNPFAETALPHGSGLPVVGGIEAEGVEDGSPHIIPNAHCEIEEILREQDLPSEVQTPASIRASEEDLEEEDGDDVKMESGNEETED